MKWLLVAFLMMTSFSAVAADDTDKKYFIINGKKFFTLRDARTYSGNKKPMPVAIPKQGITHNLAVNRPSQGKGIASGKSPLTAVGNNKPDNNIPKITGNEKQSWSNPPPAASTPPVQGAVITPVASAPKGGNKASSDMLSIFEPEGK